MPPNPTKSLEKRSQAFPPETTENISKERKHKNKEDENEKQPSQVINALSYLFFWGERWDTNIQNVWDRIPPFLGTFIASVAVFVFGFFARGDWILFSVYAFKYFQTFGSPTYIEESEELIESTQQWLSIRFKGYTGVFFWSLIISYVVYFGVGGFLHWYYYVRQRDRPEEWKCQPKKWLSPELERHEIILGSFSIIFGSLLSSTISTYAVNGGTATWLYVSPSEYGYIWLVLQVPIIFIFQDYLTYWSHRIFHTPFLYKNFHKLHHTYKQPTAFSVTAIHPVEFLFMESVLLSPIFLMPVFWFNYIVIMSYIYYHGIIDHSGINFKRAWWQPWQPDCIFHDNHHQYFHVNFGFNIEYWDRLHNTYRQKDKIYREDIYYGRGKNLSDATEDEINNEIEERTSENPLAYPENKYSYELEIDGGKGK